jgi:hypothetical protein
LIADCTRGMNSHQKAIFERLLVCSLPELIKNAANLATSTGKIGGTKRPRGRPPKISNKK